MVENLTPGKHNLIVEAIELHVLQTPSFIYALGEVLFPPACKIWSVEQGYLDPISMIHNQSSQKRSA
jgi:hypothetical protein